MADKIEKGMSDKGTLRDPSKMVSNNGGAVYAVIALVVLAVAGLAIYAGSETPTPNQPPATTAP